jgi:hypothetical protein
MCSCWFQPEGGGAVGSGLFQGVPVGIPEPFETLPRRGKIELLMTYVGWYGFSHEEESAVSDRVIENRSPEQWMNSIEVKPTLQGVLDGNSVSKNGMEVQQQGHGRDR